MTTIYIVYDISEDLGIASFTTITDHLFSTPDKRQEYIDKWFEANQYAQIQKAPAYRPTIGSDVVASCGGYDWHKSIEIGEKVIDEPLL